MKKKLLGFLLGAMLIFVCAGCGAESTSSETVETVEATSTEESTSAQTVEEVTTPVETESPTPEVTEKPSEKTAPEAEVPEATSEPEAVEESVPEPAAEPIPEPQVVYTYTDMSATMYATQTVNVRSLPNTDGEKMGSLSTNQEIAVTGQCNETGWYMFDYNGQTAFVSNSYLSTEKVEVAPPAQENTQTTTQYVAGWNDMGDWFVYVHPSLDSPENNVNGALWEDKKAILQERYPGCNTAGPIGIKLTDGTSSAWLISVGGTHSYDYPQALLNFIKVNQYKY